MAATMEILEYYFKIKNNEKVVKKGKTKFSLKKTFKRLFIYFLFLKNVKFIQTKNAFLQTNAA